MLQAQLDFLNNFESALVYMPGDNERTGCHREQAGGFDSIERLALIRSTYFAEPSTSFGLKPIDPESQAEVMAGQFAGYPENARFERDDLHVVTAHVVGSNNNFEIRDPAAAADFFARDKASNTWLADSVDKAIAEDA